jgi:hypothetical protein
MLPYYHAIVLPRLNQQDRKTHNLKAKSSSKPGKLRIKQRRNDRAVSPRYLIIVG